MSLLRQPEAVHPKNNVRCVCGRGIAIIRPINGKLTGVCAMCDERATARESGQELLGDAVSRLLDKLYKRADLLTDPVMVEAIEYTRRAYVRDRTTHGEFAMEYPVLRLPEASSGGD